MTPYRYVKRKNHPLSTPSGIIPEHRLVLWEKIGPGSHPCHRCGVQVTWLPGGRTQAGSLIVDHLDEDQRNNDPDNLAPSCQTCNIIRSRDKRFIDSPFLVVQGVRQAAEERVCHTCGGKFLALKKLLKRPRTGMYCSPRCMYDRPRK